MRYLDHYISEPGTLKQRPLPLGPLRSLVLSQVPRNRLVTLDQIKQGVRDYLENHPYERQELTDNVPRERILHLVDQFLSELILDGFVHKLPGRELGMFLGR